MTETILKRIIHVCFFAVLLVPFIVAGSMFFPYITGKAFVFRALVDVMFVSWALLAFANPAYRPRWTPIMVAMGAFVAIIGVANMMGENPARSFWSNFERMEGFIMLLHVALYLLVVGATIVHEKVWNLFWNLSLVASATLAVGGLFEVLQTAKDVRIDGTFGNSTYFAVYLLFNVFIALVFAYRSRHRLRMCAIYGGVAALLAAALYYTGTRGAILGSIAGLGVAACIVFVRGGMKHPRARRVAALGLALVVAATALFFVFRESQFVQNQRTLERIAHISLTDQTTQSRLTLWSSIGWNGFKERPLLGWGQDNFIVVFGKYYDPIMYKQEPWFDRAHNVFVDWAIAGGLFGLVSYSALFVVAMWMIFRSTMSLPEKALYVGMLVAYGVHNLFVFDNLVSYIYFATVLGYLHTREHSRESIPVVSSLPVSTLAGVGLVAGIVFIGVHGVSIVRAQTLVDALRVYRDTQDSVQVLPLFERALGGKRSTGVQETQEHMSQLALSFARTAEAGGGEAHRAFIARAYEEAAEAASMEPNNTRRLYFLATLLRDIGEYEQARVVYEQMLAINPTRQNFLYEYADIYLKQGDVDTAIEIFKQAYDAETENDTAFANYAATIMMHKSFAEGDALILDHFGTTTVDNKLIIDAYLKTGRKDRVLPILEARLGDDDLEPKQIAATRISIAAFYMDAGRRDEALEQITQAIELYPEFTDQGMKMIDAIKAGKGINIQ